MPALRPDASTPIRDYAAIGDKRTVALVSSGGAIDWFCPMGFDAPSAFAALLDPRAGSFTLEPAVPATRERCYVPGTNVLQTTYRTDGGSVRVTDALALPAVRPIDYTEIIRHVEGLAGEVPMRWRVAARFDYGTRSGTAVRRSGGTVISADHHALALVAHDAGAVQTTETGEDVHGAFTCRPGDTALLGLGSFDTGPIALPTKGELEERLGSTTDQWAALAACIRYVGPWRAAVVRSALVLDLMVDHRSGAIIAAPTTGLPEQPGGPRNYDYRYGWIRDGSLTLEAMLRLGLKEQVHSSLTWMFEATSRTHPWLRPLYTVDGSPDIGYRKLDLRGYAASRPVPAGNTAESQLQLGCYGDVFDMVWRYTAEGNALLDEAAARLVDLADVVCELWQRSDAGLWELGDRRHYTQSKVACHLALTRAGQLAEAGLIPGAGADRWAATAAEIRSYVRTRCWSDRLQSYTRAADSEELDAAVLLAARGSFLVEEPERLSSTVDAVFRHLGAGGPLLYRFSGAGAHEGAFLACSFWGAEALARCGRTEAAGTLMDELVALSSDVGLLSEEIDPHSGALLGNLPQALTHLALVNAADVCSRVPCGRSVA